MSKGQRDVVPTLEQPPLGVRIDLEVDDHGAGGDQLLLQIHRDFGPRLVLDYAAPRQLTDFLSHALSQAGNPHLMTPQLIATLSEHAAGNYRVLCHMSAELLAEALRRQVPQLDEKLYMEVFSPSSRSRSRSDARKVTA